MNYEDMNKKTLLKILRSKDASIKKLKKKFDKTLYYANRDAVTGLFNRRSGLNLLKNKIEISKINNQNLIICFIDINRFKNINDRFGHQEGDKVLRDISKIFKACVRKNDIVMRIGGDEFLIVFCNAEIDDANKLWMRISKQIDKFNKEKYSLYSISLSHGFAEYNRKNPLSIRDLVYEADKLMYMNKRRS